MVPGLQALQGQLGGLGAISGQNDAATNSAIQSLLAGGGANSLSDQSTQDYFQKSVVSPLMNTFQTQIQPKINQAFAVGGRTFSAAKGYATQRALTDIGVQAGASLGTAEQSNMQLRAQLQNQAQYQGGVLAQQQAMQPYNRAGAFQNLQLPYQTQAQNVVTGQFQQWQQQQPYANPWLSQAQSFLGQSQVALYNPTSQLKQIAPYVGAAAGAVQGAIVGSAGGPIGTGVGALVGGGLGYLGGAS